jgi:hypothetical protein
VVLLSSVLRLRLLFAPLLLSVCLLINPKSAEAQNDTAESGGTLVIPGGLAQLANAIGIDPSSLDPRSGLERIFTCLLKAEPPNNIDPQRNPLRRDLLAYLESYSQFLRFLKERDMGPFDSESSKLQEISFPFSGKRLEVEKTRELLSFFGIGSRFSVFRSDDSAVIKPEITRSPPYSDRWNLFRAMGINLYDRNLREIRVRLRSESVPLLLGEQKWERILSVQNQSDLFRRFIENPDASSLYLALAGCTRAAREALAGLVRPEQLLKSSKALLLFGSDLRFKQGTLTFPGSRQAWEHLLGAELSNPAVSLPVLLEKDDGMPLLLYSSISEAPIWVQQYLSTSSERLRSYYEILGPYSSTRFPDTICTAVGEDLPRIFRQLVADPNGPLFNLDGRVAYPLLHWIAPKQVPESGSGRVSLTPAILATMLPVRGLSPYSQISRVDILDFFRYLQDTRPEMLSEESIRALMKAPEQAPIFLNLIGGIVPTPALLARYLDYCRMLAEAGPHGWNVNRTRTSQSVFFLLSALTREGAIAQSRANGLLEDALKAFGSEDEALFANATAEFLSGELLPEVAIKARSSADPILSALSGNQPPSLIVYDGRKLVFDLASQRLRGMQRTMQSQSHTEISTLLEAYRLIREIQHSDNETIANEKLRSLSEKLNQIKTARWTPAESQHSWNSLPGIHIEELRNGIESAENSTNGSARSATWALEMAAKLHTELSITLLTYCYAYSGAPDIDILTYDPNFVRKHCFYDMRSPGPTWSASQFVQNEKIGGLMEGSLAGLDFQLIRLRIAQFNEGFGIASNIDIAPAMLFGVRQVRPGLRTDRSQEYVALVTRLGRKLISSATISDQLDHWIRGFLSLLVSQQRLEEMEDWIRLGNPASEMQILSRSELFLLGRAYLDSTNAYSCKKNGNPDRILCGTIEKINAIVPKPASPEYDVFQKEVDQYGIMLSRIGLYRLSFLMIDPYERLERDLHMQYLYDRICDLKIRIAELNYDLGLPASLGEVEADRALTDILPLSVQPYGVDWRQAIERINVLPQRAVAGWIDELTRSGSLTVPAIRVAAAERTAER